MCVCVRACARARARVRACVFVQEKKSYMNYFWVGPCILLSKDNYFFRSPLPARLWLINGSLKFTRHWLKYPLLFYYGCACRGVNKDRVISFILTQQSSDRAVSMRLDALCPLRYRRKVTRLFVTFPVRPFPLWAFFGRWGVGGGGGGSQGGGGR